ncbi:MAG: manganese-dependent inorganic pyrophosphatase [Lactobacillales bacterium]|jgi:manganese-dependent inorganic pyrophosphatase|nr:manganese-dependent inorganic pyrophosphatase [Lactobacillales bacterium]
MSKILVFGHQNPDTDAIASAIGFSHLANQQFSLNTEAVALGALNEETKYALDFFKLNPPRVIKSAASEGVDTVILTDHNEFQQSIVDIKELTVWGVVDHHRIANFATADPVFFRAEPVGSSSSIVTRMFKENQVDIPKKIAGILLSAIISDTLLFKSPTTHPSDCTTAQYLAKIAEVDLKTYGLELLKAGTNLASKSESKLLSLDAKTFPLDEKNVRVAQVNTVDINEVLTRQAALEKAMQTEIEQNGYSDFILMITDILNSNSEILVVGKNNEKIEKAFGIQLKDHHAFLKGVVSRKKQIIPQLTESYEKGIKNEENKAKNI